MRFKVKAPVWISTLYFAEGMPAAVICEVSLVIFSALGRPKESIPLAVSVLGMPWMLKPLWSCLVDLYGTKRWWIVGAETLMALLFALAAGFSANFGWLWWMLFAAAVVSATHDIAADGFYLVALDDHRQSLYSGLRSVFYRAAMIAANGGLIYAAAQLGKWGVARPWLWGLGIAAALFGVLALFHRLALPTEERGAAAKVGFGGLVAVLKEFAKIPDLWRFIVFLLLFRFAEAQLTIVSRQFLLARYNGTIGVATVFSALSSGLSAGSLTETQYSVMVGTIGVAAMLAGGVAGGFFAARVGLRRALLPMALALNVPDALYAWWAFFPVRNPIVQASFIGIEQLGYGFGFTGYMLVMIYLANKCGAFQTTVFSLLSCLMIAGLRVPGMFSGILLKHAGVLGMTDYQGFFLWVLAVTPLSFAATWLAMRVIPADYGRKR
jgi:PAT family beta-lactamase induction signal transducer AmpG